MLGVATGPSFWTEFLRSLADRGVKLVIADDHKGLRAAARRVLNGEPCRAIGPSDNGEPSKVAGSLDAERVGARPGQAAHGRCGDAEDVFAQENKADAETQWEAGADALHEKNEKLGTFMDASRNDVLAYMAFPREHWAQIASTNSLERVNREIKRRADVIGIFPTDAAIVRLVGASAMGLGPMAAPWRTAGDQRRMGRGAPVHEP